MKVVKVILPVPAKIASSIAILVVSRHFITVFYPLGKRIIAVSIITAHTGMPIPTSDEIYREFDTSIVS